MCPRGVDADEAKEDAGLLPELLKSLLSVALAGQSFAVNGCLAAYVAFCN